MESAAVETFFLTRLIDFENDVFDLFMERCTTMKLFDYVNSFFSIINIIIMLIYSNELIL